MSTAPISFFDFPPDVQLNILSFLSLSDLSSFASTSRPSSLLSRSHPLFFSLSHRRWAHLTHLPLWSHNYPLLFKSLNRWENLIGFWRPMGPTTNNSNSPLLFFEWAPSFISGSWVSPGALPDCYNVVKKPFVWLGLSPAGEPRCFFNPVAGGGDSSELVPVSVSFIGNNHLVLEESFGIDDNDSSEEVKVIESESPPERAMSEIYMYFANRTSPGSDRSARRQRRKRGGRRGIKEALHFVKIGNCVPTVDRPLQGLWKGITEDMKLEFFMVIYDDLGGICCRRVCEAGELISGYPVFWNSKTSFVEPPFLSEECDLYGSRVHICPSEWKCKRSLEVSRILNINSSYDLVIPDLTSSSGNPRNAEGRIWLYDDGTFGFGFLRNNYIIDLKHIAHNGSLLDTVDYLSNDPSL